MESTINRNGTSVLFVLTSAMFAPACTHGGGGQQDETTDWSADANRRVEPGMFSANAGRCVMASVGGDVMERIDGSWQVTGAVGPPGGMVRGISVTAEVVYGVGSDGLWSWDGTAPVQQADEPPGRYFQAVATGNNDGIVLSVENLDENITEAVPKAFLAPLTDPGQEAEIRGAKGAWAAALLGKTPIVTVIGGLWVKDTNDWRFISLHAHEVIDHVRTLPDGSVFAASQEAFYGGPLDAMIRVATPAGEFESIGPVGPSELWAVLNSAEGGKVQHWKDGVWEAVALSDFDAGRVGICGDVVILTGTDISKSTVRILEGDIGGFTEVWSRER